VSYDETNEDYDLSMLELFKIELENHTGVLENGLVSIEQDQSSENIEPLMRAAHSIKGAARIVGLDIAVGLAHAMEDMLSTCQGGKYTIDKDDIDLMLKANDIYVDLMNYDVNEIPDRLIAVKDDIDSLTQTLREYLDGNKPVKAIQQPLSPKPKEEIHEVSNEAEEGIDMSMLELFQIEVENNTQLLESGLLDVEHDQSADNIEPLMRAAHSIKGASRIVGLDNSVTLSHAMEDVLTSVQKGDLKLDSDDIDLLLQCNDLYKGILGLSIEEIPVYLKSNIGRINEYTNILKSILSGNKPARKEQSIVKPQETKITQLDYKETKIEKQKPKSIEQPKKQKKESGQDGTFVRVLSENLNKLMGLAGESLVQTKSLKPFSQSLQMIKNSFMELHSNYENLLLWLRDESIPEDMKNRLELSFEKFDSISSHMSNHIENFAKFTRQMESLSDRLYNETVETRMKPFSEGVLGFPRLVRDISKQLEKKATLEIRGQNTSVDRDILEKLESPLNHLIRNALDHGLEMPEERVAAGKPEQGTITLEAHHRSGMLIISVRDDGRGIDLEKLKVKIVDRGYATKEMVSEMSNNELIDFLFLPGFSTAGKVTEISGRGVGLDVVFAMVHEVGGTVRADSEFGKYTVFMLQLPLTLSVLRTLIVEICNEPYALPLSRIDRILILNKQDLKIIEDRQYCEFDGENIGIIDAHQVFKKPITNTDDDKYHIAIISDLMDRYGIAVDRFLGERDVVVTPLDHRLGRIPNISAGSITEDGRPLLIIDVDDLVRSVDNLLNKEKIRKIGVRQELIARRRKRILVVDDSITVRELEKKLLTKSGYDVTVAVDGIDGWNSLHRDEFDMVVSDVDMPRMNGIDLVKRIKSDPKLKQLPVMIVSYKDREEDKMRGLEAGANYYLTKSSFHDETLVEVVRELIGDYND
jgi:two-component system sensor histidine kinase and response regulator WspE